MMLNQNNFYDVRRLMGELDLDLLKDFDVSPIPMYLVDSKRKEIIRYNSAFSKGKSRFQKSLIYFVEHVNDFSSMKCIQVDKDHEPFLFNLVALNASIALVQVIEIAQPSMHNHPTKWNKTSTAKEDFTDLFEKQSLIQKVIELSPIGLVFTDDQFKIKSFNAKFRDLFESKGNRFENLLDGIQFDNISRFYKKIEKLY